MREASLRITYGFIYIIFRKGQNHHNAEHIRICQSFWIGENMAIKESFGVIELFYIPIVVVVTYIYTCVKLNEKGKKDHFTG